MSGCGVRGDALRVARDPERSNSRPLRSGAAGGNRFYISLRRRQFPGRDSAYPGEQPGRDLPAQRRRAGANENLVPQRDRGGNRRGHCTSCAAGQGRAVKLLIYSHSFAPRLGGVETVVMALARGLSAASTGQGREPMEVTVATPAPRGNFDDASLPFRVVRQPGFWGLLRLLRSADLTHLAGPALLPLFLALILRRPVVVEHHGYQAICPNGLLLIEPTQTVCPGHFQARRYRKCWECNRASEGSIKSLQMLLLTFPRRWLCRSLARNISVTDHVRRRLQLPHSEVIYHGISIASPSSDSIVEPPPASAPLCFG